MSSLRQPHLFAFFLIFDRCAIWSGGRYGLQICHVKAPLHVWFRFVLFFSLDRSPGPSLNVSVECERDPRRTPLSPRHIIDVEYHPLSSYCPPCGQNWHTTISPSSVVCPNPSPAAAAPTAAPPPLRPPSLTAHTSSPDLRSQPFFFASILTRLRPQGSLCSGWASVT